MSRRRGKSSSPNDSFDLFLDTITNTFGGILLIALLLVLLIKETPENPTETTQTETRSSLEQKIERLQAEKLNLEQAEQIRRDIAENLKSGDTEEIASLMAELERQNQESQQQTDESKNIAALNDKIRDTRTRAAKLEQEITEQQEKLKKLSAKLAEAAKRQTRSMPTPKEQPTNKNPTTVLVKNGRLYIVDKNRGHGTLTVDPYFFTPTSSNPDMILDVDTKYKIIQSNGIRMSDPNLLAHIKKFSQRCYIQFAVYPDSYDEFSKVRSACVEAGFKINIAPWKGPVTFGGSGRSTAQ